MTTRYEGFDPKSSSWYLLDELQPGSKPATITNFRPDGIREIIQFFCAPDDSRSVIFRLDSEGDILLGEQHINFPAKLPIKVLRELRNGESHEMPVRLSNTSAERKVRLTHVTE